MNGLNFDEVAEYPESKEIVQSKIFNLDAVRPGFDRYKQEAQRIAAEAKDLTVQDQESLELAVAGGGKAKRVAAIVETSRLSIISAPQAFVDGVNGLCRMITDQLVIKKNAKKEIVNPDCAENLLKDKIGQYQARVEMERRERERKAREETEALQRRLDEEVAEANRKAQEGARKRAEEEQRIKREKEEAEAKERGAKAAELKTLAEKAEKERQEAIKRAEEEAKKNEVVAPTVVAPVVQSAPSVTRTESGSSYQAKRTVCRIVNPAEVPREYCEPVQKLLDNAVKMGCREIKGCVIEEITETRFRT